MLKEAAPAIRRVLVIAQPGNLGQLGLLRGTQTAAPAVRVQVVPAMVDSSGREHTIDEFATEPNGGLIGLPGHPSANDSDQIIALAARSPMNDPSWSP
jgi:hypothetical protein